MCMRAVAADDASAAPFIAHPTRAFAATDIDSDRFPIVPAKALDMIVVPLVAFDQTGARLGYGERLLRPLPDHALARMPNHRHRL